MPPPEAERTALGTLATFASYVALSVAWSWPLAVAPAGTVTRHFDLYPSIWLLQRARAAVPGLEHAASAWPVGESLARVDSYVLLALGWLDGGALGGARIAWLVALLGPALGASAAEWAASSAFRVPRPWSWIAGVAWGFSGITATAMLEGHVHHLLNPWFPLLLGCAWSAQEGRGPQWALGAGLFWALSLYTSAYFGVMGFVFLLAVALRAGLERISPASLVAVPAGVAYAWLFASGQRFADAATPQRHELWEMGATTLEGLFGWSEALDLRFHSLSAPVGWTVFWLLLLAPFVLRGRRGWKMLFGLALLALLLTLGRTIRATPEHEGWASPVRLALGLPGIEWFRFPLRFAWLYALCGGVVAARVAAELATGRRLLGVGLLVLCAGDAIVGTGLPWRLRQAPAGIPSAYAAAPEGRAVLDLYAPAGDYTRMELELWARALSCRYQAEHGRPILEVCIGTDVESPREVVTAWVSGHLLAPQPEVDAIVATLGRLGVGAVALHADVYRPSDRVAMEAALTVALGQPAAESRDAGEHVLLWAVPEVDVADWDGAWNAIRAGASPVVSSAGRRTRGWPSP